VKRILTELATCISDIAIEVGTEVENFDHQFRGVEVHAHMREALAAMVRAREAVKRCTLGRQESVMNRK
jgi:hypothetical protein